MSNALGKYAASQKTERTSTPQTKRTANRTDEVKNNAGGFIFKVSDKDRLERFMILGTDKGTFYVKERKFTDENIKFLKDMISRNERLVIDTAVDVSVKGRAKSNSQALFALALAMTFGKDKAYTREAVQKVARTSTHLFEYAEYIDSLGGWGRAKRASIAEWYENKSVDALAYQAVKYRQRNGWTHRDLFRKSHPRGVDQSVGNFILGKGNIVKADGGIINGFENMQHAKTVDDVVKVLKEFKSLPWETIPTQFLTDAKVWKTLFYNGAIGQTALLRNVTRFAKIGAFNDLQFAGDVAMRLSDKSAIEKGRVHPIAYLNALHIYRDGRAEKNSGWASYLTRVKDWDVNAKVVGALEAGFYNAFGTVKPANKRTMASIDISGSMTWDAPAGLVGLDCRQAAAAMAMVLIRSEPYVTINAFSTSLNETGISDADSLETVVRKIDRLPMGGTDCAQPMVNALKSGVEIDTFTVWTDSETWAGAIKPSQALKRYRDKTGIDARLVVVGMVSNDFTIADPQDRGMLDVVGFDANAPGVIADFSAGRI